MTERQMEDLIAEFPNDFFRSHGLILKDGSNRLRRWAGSICYL